MNSWSENVPYIVDGKSTFSASSLNPTIAALDARTRYLKDQQTYLSTNANQGLIYVDRGFSAEVVEYGVGALLAVDSSNNYVLASAELQDTPVAAGGQVPSDRCYVIGALISPVDNDGYGTILSYGHITDAAVVQQLTGGSGIGGDAPATGAYYLGTEGKAVPASSANLAIPVYCFTYTSSGSIIFAPRAPELNGHRHCNVSLPSNKWVSVAKSDLPEDVLNSIGESGSDFMKYPTANDPELLNVLEAGFETATPVKNGIAVSDKDWGYYGIGGDDDLQGIYVAFNVHPDDEIELYLTIPSVYPEPIVRRVSIRANDALLAAQNYGGTVVLESRTDKTRAGSDQYTGTAVLDIDSKNGIAIGSVVHEIYEGPGVAITPAKRMDGTTSPGCYMISSADATRTQIDMQVSNLSGVLFGTESDKVSYKFPANQTSSLYGTFRVPHYESSGLNPKLNVLVKGNGTAIPSFTALITTIPHPGETGESQVIGPQSYTIPGKTSTLTQNYYLLSVPLVAGSYPSDALMSCKLTLTAEATAVTLVAMSLQLVG